MICVYPKIGKNSKVPFQIWKKTVLSNMFYVIVVTWAHVNKRVKYL